MKTKVTIIIPVYNAEDFIVRCLESVIQQRFDEGLECIIIDDCGHDQSIELAKSLIARNDRNSTKLKIIRQERNMGPSAARNRGIREAQGDYIYFLDADDSISPDCINRLYTIAKENDSDYVQGSYDNTATDKAPAYPADLPIVSTDRCFIKATLLNHNIIQFTPHNRLIRRTLILDNNLFFNTNLVVREDFHWMFFVAKYVQRFAVCREPIYYRGYNVDSLTHKINVEREIIGYKTLVEDFTSNIDSFLPGNQKALILETLIMALNSHYYHNENEKKYLINVFMTCNNRLEKVLLRIYLSMKNCSLKAKILHLLIRIYKI